MKIILLGRLPAETEVGGVISFTYNIAQHLHNDIDKVVDFYPSKNRKQLPEKLKGKSDKELKEYVEQQKKIRSEIVAKINELNTKRKVFIAKKQSESMKKNELENVMIQAIKKQAKKKNYSW